MKPAAFAVLSTFVGSAVLGVLVGGCVGRSNPSPSSSPDKSASKTKPKATPLPLAVSLSNMDATISDAKGVIVATVKATGANVGPGNANASDPIGSARDASAVLYQAGKPAATFQAAMLHADRDAGVVVGVGGVTLRSLTEPGSPAIRADTMTWTHGENHVVGQGNVLLVRQGDSRFPATRLTGTHFTADTALRKYVLYDVGTPANAGASRDAPKGTPTEKPVASGNF